jgi:hypothetical protein
MDAPAFIAAQLVGALLALLAARFLFGTPAASVDVSGEFT